MEQLRCPKCNHRLLDIDSARYRIKTRCRNCKGWCSFESKGNEQEREGERQ